MAQPGTSFLADIRRRARAAARGLILLLLLATPVAAAGVAVQAVEVRLLLDGLAPPAPVRDRLQETVGTVAQRLLVGRPVEQLRPAQAQLQATLATVVGRVIAGYSVAEVRVDVAPTAIVAVRLRPEPPLVQAVEVVPRAEVDPAVGPLLLQPVAQTVTPAVRAMFLGLPVAALEWTAPLVAEDVRRAVENVLPGFTAAVRVRPAALAQVELDLMPRDARVVRDIGVRFRSGSIPLVLLDPYAPAVTSMAGPIRGLPVAFVERQRDALERLLVERFRAYPPAIEYRIVVRPVLSVGETTFVTVVADSLVWLGRVEAAVNVGANAPGPELRVHLGRLFGRLEGFAEIGLVPNTLSARYDVGARYEINDALDLGASYTINTAETTGFVIYRLTPDLSVRMAYALPAREFEGSVRYRFNEFLSGELVGTSEGDYWLRLISNL